MSSQPQATSSYDFLRKQATAYRVALSVLAVVAMVLAVVNYQMLDENFVSTEFTMAVLIFTLTAVFGFICLGMVRGYLKVRRSTIAALRAGTVTEVSGAPVRASKRKRKGHF